MEVKTLNYRWIFWFWLPLTSTWLMMAVEGPYLVAVIARLSNPTNNLAAFGVAFSIAVIIEAASHHADGHLYQVGRRSAVILSPCDASLTG